MKRSAYATLLVLVLLVSGCKTPADLNTGTPGANFSPSATQPILAPSLAPSVKVEDGAPNIVGLYLRNNAREDLLAGYDQPWVKGKDIATFHAFASGDNTLAGSTGGIFMNCWKKFPKSENYKVGYFLSFTLKSSEVVNLTIRGPEDAPKDPSKYFYQYIEVYMYDAVHQTGFHSHLTKTEPNTLLTSIKLTAGTKIGDVASIRLSAFVYKDATYFDTKTGQYIGNVSFQIPINNGK